MDQQSSCKCYKRVGIKWEHVCAECKTRSLEELRVHIESTENYSETLRRLYLGEDISDAEPNILAVMRRDGVIASAARPSITDKGTDFIYTHGV